MSCCASPITLVIGSNYTGQISNVRVSGVIPSPSWPVVITWVLYNEDDSPIATGLGSLAGDVISFTISAANIAVQQPVSPDTFTEGRFALTATFTIGVDTVTNTWGDEVTFTNPVASTCDANGCSGGSGGTSPPVTSGVSSVNGFTGVVVLTAADVGADSVGAAAGEMSAHLAASNPHPQYVTASTLTTTLLAYAPIVTPILSGMVTVRQNGGTVGVDEVQISHDGTNTLIESKEGAIRFRPGGMSNGISLELQGVTANTVQFQVIGAGTDIIWVNPFAVTAMRDAVANWWKIDYDKGFIFGQTGGGYNVGLDWLAPGVWKITDAGSGDGSIQGGFKLITMADGSAANNTLYFSSTASKAVYKDGSGVVNPLY